MKKILSIFLLVTMILSVVSVGSFAESNFNVLVELDDKELTISGGGVSSIKNIVTVKIDDPDGNIFNINQIKSDENGNFIYKLSFLETDATGNYTVTVSTREPSEKISETVYYLSKTTMAEISSAINSDSSVIADYKSELNIEDFSDAELENAANMLAWLKDDSGYTFEEIISVVKRSKALWENISECNESNLTGVIKTNADVLFENEETVFSYNNLSSANKRAVNTIVLDSSYTDYDELRAVIKSAVETISSNIEKRLIYIQGDINVNVISISGNGVKTARKIVTLKVTDDSGKIVNINQIEADDKGEFSYSVTLGDNEKSGKYSVYAYSRQIDEIASVTDLIYLNKIDRDDITSKVNSASDASQIEEILKANYEVMGLSEYSADDFKSASVILNIQKTGKNVEYAEITNAVKTGKTITDEINKTDWSALDAYITQKGESFLSDLSEYSKYNSVSGAANRNKLCKIIMESAPFKNLEAFRTAFKNAVNSYNPYVSGPAGGGGGGGGSSPSKGGSTSSAISGVNQYNTVPAGYESKGFGDLENHEWARESIEGLLARGVVANAPDGKFRPQDNITREEFIKLLVCAFALTDSGASCNFSDVPADAWYYVYVASAYKNNVTKGINDYTFGTGQVIRRQEMASLAYRVVKNLGLEINVDGSEKTFNDNAGIAEYAKEAVSVMQKSGIINGDENGNFRPDGSATRAEAAKIIYKLLVTVGM